MKKTSLADIAKALSVSKALVSIVLNGKGNDHGINEDTQKRVIAKAKELNYKPNAIARGLRTGKSNTLGLIVADISNVFYAKICRAIEEKAWERGYHIMISSTEEKPERESDLIRVFRERQVDGLILSTTQMDHKAILQMKKEKFPFVLIDRQLPNEDTNYVLVDNLGGAFEVTEHLINLGFKRIGQLTISPAHLSTLRDRTQGYKDALVKHGMKVEDSLIREVPFDDVREGVRRELKELASPPNSVDAVFVANNNLAINALICLKEMELRIPQDVAMVVFDDIDMFRFVHPPITAVAQPIEEIGYRALDMLLDKINKKDKDDGYDHVVLKPELVIRRSCGSYLRSI